jgi:hypothetical protein
MKKKYLLENFVEATIKERSNAGKLLAKKFPELKGLTYSEFLMKLPIELDFITSCEMYEAINKPSIRY